MATSYVKQATSKLAPAYTQQINAYKSQIPAVQQLYETLNKGLTGQQAAGNQTILENASSRGLLKSTIPVYDQSVLGAQIIQQQGQNAANEQQALAQINQGIAGIGVDQANAIAQLANALWQQANQTQQFNFTKQQANRDYALQQKLGNQQFELAKQKASL